MRKNRSMWAAVLAVIGAQAAWGFPPYLTEWQSQYPSSTLPARMLATTGSDCHVCHHPPTRDLPGNCYRTDIIALLGGGATIADAISQLDGVDSDGDGVPNGVEATTARQDQPGEVGYSMGLVGPTGTDPCSLEPGVAITGELETAPPPIPTVSEWGLALMVLLALVAGTLVFRSQSRPQPAYV